MSARGVAEILEAWRIGRPLPRYDTLHHAITSADQVLIVAFVRMAGESRPWAIGWGVPGSTPTVASVPDGRVRDDVAALCASLARDLIAHLHAGGPFADPAISPPDPSALHQVWLPNGQHIAMLHQVGYTYSQTRFGGADRDLLRAFGRIAGWMFRDTSRVGNQHVVDASALLTASYVVPAQRVRTAHLGYTLGWLTADGAREERLTAAMAAERLTVSPTMDPATERDPLAGLVDQWNDARRGNGDMAQPAALIARVLDGEVRRRWRLTEQAYLVLAADERPVNEGVTALVAESQREFWYQYLRMEQRHADPDQGPAFVAHPETDFHGSAAASRYLIHEAADEGYLGHLIHHDHALFQRALDDGRGFQGQVVGVEDAGTGKATAPRWVLRLDPTLPHRLRETTRVAPLGSRGHEAMVLDINASAEDLLVTIEWTTRKTKPLMGPLHTVPVDHMWLGMTVRFVIADAASLTLRRSRRVWSAAEGPGAWLTHGVPTAPIEITGDDDRVDLVLDDIVQISEGVQL